jgi:hypothetical protein
MRWRLSKLNWSYGLGELIIVIAGVLTALSVDQWNSDRLDRLEEGRIVERLTFDLNTDLEAVAIMLRSLDNKEASLLRVNAVLAAADAPPQDPAEFLRDIVVGANYGWNQYEVRRTTISELIGSGKLTLIRDAQLRVKIADYYDSARANHQRIDERETAYPQISYQLVRRANEGSLMADSDVVELDHDDLEIEQIFAKVINSPLNAHVNAELNLARFIRATEIRLQIKCRDLIAELDAYRETIR